MIIYALNETITRCPPNFPPEYMSYPSSAILYGVLSIATFAFALFIIIKYNSVKVWDKSFSPLYISNTLWIIYYLALFTRASCNTVRYALRPDANIEVTNILSLSNLILQGISAFALSLTINHQRKYRSTAPIHPNPNASAASIAGAGEKAPLVNTHGSMRAETGWLKAVSFIEILFSIFFLIYLVFLYLVLIKGHDEVFESLFFGGICATTPSHCSYDYRHSRATVRGRTYQKEQNCVPGWLPFTSCQRFTHFYVGADITTYLHYF